MSESYLIERFSELGYQLRQWAVEQGLDEVLSSSRYVPPIPRAPFATQLEWRGVRLGELLVAVRGYRIGDAGPDPDRVYKLFGAMVEAQATPDQIKAFCDAVAPAVSAPRTRGLATPFLHLAKVLAVVGSHEGWGLFADDKVLRVSYGKAWEAELGQQHIHLAKSRPRGAGFRMEPVHYRRLRRAHGIDFQAALFSKQGDISLLGKLGATLDLVMKVGKGKVSPEMEMVFCLAYEAGDACKREMLRFFKARRGKYQPRLDEIRERVKKAAEIGRLPWPQFPAGPIRRALGDLVTLIEFNRIFGPPSSWEGVKAGPEARHRIKKALSMVKLLNVEKLGLGPDYYEDNQETLALKLQQRIR